MTNRDHEPSLSRQAELLGISRGSLYSDPRPVCEDDLRLMRRTGRLHLDCPFAGSRMRERACSGRKALAWRLSVTLETEPCPEALKDAGIRIRMDGKGAWRDNVFVERLWRTIKYEELYLRAHDNVTAARQSLRRYIDFYTGRRPHSSLDGQTPDLAYLNPSSPIPVAA